jgi:uncharacterized protein YjbI with pentapeptide repeats
LKSDARASLDDLAIRWETPRGREIKAEILQDIRHNRGERLAEILKEFIYVNEVPDGRDLRCITLEELDLNDTTWRKCDLSWASFARSSLLRADFREANLKRANLVESNVSLARFAEADCARADFSKANVEHANFKETKLNGAVFVNSNCARVGFDTANLVKCNFVGASLEQANFTGADCNNGNFSGAAFEQMAAKPAKAWGIVYDMALDEFERKVGLNSLTSRTTKKFKGLDVLLKASAALAKVNKKTGPQPTLDEVALGAPPGMRRLETFKRPEEQGSEMVFGATLKKTKKLDEPEKVAGASDVASASDYIDEASSFDPDDPSGTHYPEQEESGELGGVTDEAVGAIWTDGRPESGGDEAPPGAPTATPRAQPRPPSDFQPIAPGQGGPSRVTRTPSTQSGAIPRPPTGSMSPSPATPPSGTPVAGPRPPSAKLTGGTGRMKPPTVPGTGPAPAAPPGASSPPHKSTRIMPRAPDLGGTPPAAAPLPKPAPSFMAPLDPAAADPTADWAKAIGQLMQNKSSITKIVIELGDKSRIVFKKS